MKPHSYQTKVNLPGLDVEVKFDSQQLALWVAAQTHDLVLFLINFVVISATGIRQLGYNAKCWVRLQTQHEVELFLALVRLQSTKLYRVVWLNPWQDFTNSVVTQYERLAHWLLKAVGQELGSPQAPLALQQATKPEG